MWVASGTCKRSSPAYRTVQAVTRARDASSTLSGSAAVNLTQAQTVVQPRTSGRTGPLFRVYATSWQPEEGAPIWMQVCPAATVTTVLND